MTPNRRSLPSLVRCSALVAALTVGPSAFADGVAPNDATPVQKKEAMDHFTAGKTAFEAKNWEKAIGELRASLDVVNSPNTRLQLARALRDAGQLDDAYAEYGRAQDDANILAVKEPRYSQTADAAAGERSDIEPKLAFVTLTIQNAPPKATLKVGGRPVPADQWTLPLVVSAGTVDVVLSDGTGKELARQSVAATVGQKAPVTLDGAPPPPPPPKPGPVSAEDKPDYAKAPPPPPAPPRSAGRAGLRPYAYIAGGVGVAGLAVFSIFGAMSSSDFNDLKSSCPHGACPSSKAGEINDGKTFQTVANVGLGVGIAGVAAGATLFVLSITGSSPEATSLQVGPGYIGLRGSL